MIFITFIPFFNSHGLRVVKNAFKKEIQGKTVNEFLKKEKEEKNDYVM